MQTKYQSHIEVTINQILGIIGGWLIVYFIFLAAEKPKTAKFGGSLYTGFLLYLPMRKGRLR